VSAIVTEFIASRNCPASVMKQFNKKCEDLSKWEKISRFEYKLDLPNGFRGLGVLEVVGGETLLSRHGRVT
jgi:hypothetical protein